MSMYSRSTATNSDIFEVRKSVYFFQPVPPAYVGPHSVALKVFHCRASSGVIMNFWLICGNAPAWAAAAGLAWAPSDVRLKTAPAATHAAVFRKVRREEPVVLFRDLLTEPSS